MMSFFGISPCDWLMPVALWEKRWENTRNPLGKTLEMTSCYFLNKMVMFTF